MYGDLFPEIVNPFKVPLTQGIPETISNILPQQITGGFTGQQNVNTNQVQGITPNFDQLNLDQKINKSNNLDNFIKS